MMEFLFFCAYVLIGFIYGAYLDRATYLPGELIIISGIFWIVVLPISIAIWLGQKIADLIP